MGSAQMIGWASAVSARLWAIGGGTDASLGRASETWC